MFDMLLWSLDLKPPVGFPSPRPKVVAERGRTRPTGDCNLHDEKPIVEPSEIFLSEFPVLSCLVSQRGFMKLYPGVIVDGTFNQLRLRTCVNSSKGRS